MNNNNRQVTLFISKYQTLDLSLVFLVLSITMGIPTLVRYLYNQAPKESHLLYILTNLISTQIMNLHMHAKQLYLPLNLQMSIHETSE